MKMKKISIIILIVLFFGACKNEQTSEDIKSKIVDYNEKIFELQQQLDTLSNKKDIKAIAVKTVDVKKQRSVHYIQATAYVKAKEQAFVSPQMNGQIVHIYVKEGQFVKKGQTWVVLNANVLKSSIEEVKTGLSLATTLYNKQKELWEQKIGKELDYLQAKNRKESLEAKLKTLNAQLAMTVIKAPISGIIDEIYSKEGEMAAPGRQVINLVNLHKMEADADVSEKYLPYIHEHDSVTLTFPAYPNFVIKTKITRTGNVINPVNRTFKVQVDFNNKNKSIKPNMIAQVNLSDYKGNDIKVSSIIVKTDTKGDYLFIAKEENGIYRAEKVYIKTSFLIGDDVIITEGLKEGDKVITEGYNLISNNQVVAIK